MQEAFHIHINAQTVLRFPDRVVGKQQYHSLRNVRTVWALI